MMRIGMISASRIPSRAANSIEVMKVAHSFIELGHQVRLWAPEQDQKLPGSEIEQWYGLQQAVPIEWVPSAPAWRRYDFAWKAVRQARQWASDLVYCWPLQAAALSCILGLPTALEVHDRPGGLFGWRLMSFILNSGHARRILPITEALRTWLEEAFRMKLDSPRCLIAPMGVDLDSYESLPDPEHARARLELEERLTVGYTGHLYQGRGLELMTSLAERNPDLAFLWVGGEPDHVMEWRTRLKSEGLSNIRLTGFVPNEYLPMYQAACDILLMPYEAHIAGSSGGDTAQFASPMKAFEYLAAGRAIVSSDLDVIREVLDAEVSVLIPAGDVDAWDGALKLLVEEPRLREQIGEAAKARARAYSWKSRAARILDGLENG
jgi:glycosyltransferase involved in cell wall biosynthesis